MAKVKTEKADNVGYVYYDTGSALSTETTVSSTDRYDLQNKTWTETSTDSSGVTTTYSGTLTKQEVKTLDLLAEDAFTFYQQDPILHSTLIQDSDPYEWAYATVDNPGPEPTPDNTTVLLHDNPQTVNGSPAYAEDYYIGSLEADLALRDYLQFLDNKYGAPASIDFA